MYSTLTLEKKDAVATIWMDRPEVYNAFNEALIQDLRAACLVLDDDADVRVVVLAGRGKHFSAGADLNWMQRTASASLEQNVADAREFADMLRRLAQMGKPTIARVQGAALGGGTGLAAACDMAISSDHARFAISEVKFGIIPAVISPYVLRAIGPRQALRYFQTAENISSQEALKIGLVHDVVPIEQLDDRIQTLTVSLLKGGPRAQKSAKALIQSVSGRTIDESLCEDTAQRIANQRATAEAREGIAAFLEKRPPQWTTNK